MPPRISTLNYPTLQHRLLAFFVLLAFLINTLFSFPALAAVSLTNNALRHSEYSISSFPGIQNLALPPGLGTVEDRYQGLGPETVILIQDAHAIPDAQKSILQLIEHFSHRYGVHLIAAEGASGKMDPTLFRTFPDRRLIQNVFGDYLSRGELSGAAAASVLNDEEADYYGIEDQALYEKTVNEFLAAIQNQPLIISEIEKQKHRLNRLKKKYYSSELLQLDQQVEAFEDQAVDLLRFLKFLKLFSKKPLSRPYPHLAVALAQIKKNVSSAPDSIPGEIKHLQSIVQKALRSQEEIRKFHARLQDYRTERISQEAFSDFLWRLSLRQDISIPLSSALRRNIKQYAFLEQMKGAEFFKELEAYISEIKKGLFQSQKEREWDRAAHRLRLLHKLAKLELTRDEWEEIKTVIPRLAPQGLSRSYGRKSINGIDRGIHTLDSRFSATKKDGPAVNFGGRGNDKGVLLGALDAHFHFYENAEKRDHVFFMNLMELMNQTNVEATPRGLPSGSGQARGSAPTILIAGGFHAQGLTRLFKQKGISFLLISPRMQAVPDETHYLDYMKGQVSWKQYFKIHNGRIDLYEAFSQFAVDRLIHANPALARPWREALIRDLALEKRLAESPQYTRFLDSAVVRTMDPKEQEVLKEAWLKKVDQFVLNLRHLKNNRELTPENVMRLTASQTAAVWTAIPFVRGSQPAQWLAQERAPQSVTRSETRLLQPAFPWRLRAAKPLITAFYTKVVRSRIPVEIEGWENLPEDGNFILVGNHFSLFDGLIIAFEIYLRTGRLVLFIAKPKFLDFFQNLLVWLRAAIKVEYKKTTVKVEDALKQGWSIGFFPGRRVAPDPDYAFKSWKPTFAQLATKYRKPVVPVAVSGKMPVSLWSFHAGQDPQSKFSLKIRFGRPLSWEGLAGQEKETPVLEKEAKAAIRQMLKGKTTYLLNGEGKKIHGGTFPEIEISDSDQPEENEFAEDPKRSELRANHFLPNSGHTAEDILKLSASVNRERERAYLEAAKRQPAIVIYGSARVPESHRYHKLGVELGEKIWEYSRKTGIPLPPRTGAGMSLMDAPLKGYRKARGEKYKTPLNQTQGIRIELPFEAEISPNIEVGNGEVKPYKYFLIRKTALHENSLGAIALPGGFGTLDEVFESWRRHRPLVLLDEEFWKPIINAYYNAFEQAGFADKITNRPLITSSIDTAIKYILEEAEKNPPFMPDRTHLAGIEEEFETNLTKIYSMPRSVVFVGRLDLAGNGRELKIAVGLADALVKRHKVPVRLASRGSLFHTIYKKSVAHEWDDALQAVLREPASDPLKDEEKKLNQWKHVLTVRDQSNSQFLTASNAFAYVFLPGMQGTQNRLMDLATLIQTRKMDRKPIILIGREFYSPILYALADMMFKHPNSYPMISADDLRLFHIVDNVQEAVEVLIRGGIIKDKTAKRSEIRNEDQKLSSEQVSQELLNLIEQHERESSKMRPFIYHRLLEMRNQWPVRIEDAEIADLTNQLEETLTEIFGPRFSHHGDTWNISQAERILTFHTASQAFKLKMTQKNKSSVVVSETSNGTQPDYVSDWAGDFPERVVDDYTLYLTPPVSTAQFFQDKEASFAVDSVKQEKEETWDELIRVPAASSQNANTIQFIKALVPNISETTDKIQAAVEVLVRPDTQNTHGIYARVQRGPGEVLEKTRLFQHRGRTYALWEAPRSEFGDAAGVLQIQFGGLTRSDDLAGTTHLMHMAENGEAMIRGTTLESDLYAMKAIRREEKDWMNEVVSDFRTKFEANYRPVWMERIEVAFPARSETRSENISSDTQDVVRPLRNFTLAMSVMEAGAEIVKDPDGRKRIVYRNNLERASALLPVLKNKLGAGEVYLYGGLYEPPASPGIAEKLHQVPNREEHFLQSRDGKVVAMTKNYHTKEEKAGDLTLRDDQGNPFSIKSMLDFNPLLSGTPRKAGTAEKSKEQFKTLTDQARKLGMKVIVDFIPWLAPDAINAANLHWTFHRRLEPWQNEQFRSLNENDKSKAIEKLIRDNKGDFFAVRVGQGNQEEVVLVRHLQSMGRPNVDEAILNPLVPEVMEYYLKALENLIDLGVDKVRVDLGGNLLLWNLGPYVSDFGKNPDAARQLEHREEPWQQILRETLAYAKSKGRSFEFIMEAYHPGEQDYLADLSTRVEGEQDPSLGAVRVYFKDVFSKLFEIKNGNRVAALDEKIQEALFVRFHPNQKRRRVKFMIFPSNFDQIPWSKMNLAQDSLALFSVLAYLGEDLGLNVMVMLRDILMNQGSLPPLPGGDIAENRTSNLEGENAHPFPTLEEIETLANPEKLQKAIANSPTAQFMKAFSDVVGKNGQTDIQFLDNSNRDRFITLAWKNEEGDWIVLAKNLKPRNGEPLYLDFIEFPDAASRQVEGRLHEWQVVDPFTGQYSRTVTEFHEGKAFPRIKENLSFSDRDYKFLVLKSAQKPIQLFRDPALNLKNGDYDLKPTELQQRSEVRNAAPGFLLENRIRGYLSEIENLMKKKPWQFYEVDIVQRDSAVQDIQKGLYSIQAIIEQAFREMIEKAKRYPLDRVNFLTKVETAAREFAMLLTVLDELNTARHLRLHPLALSLRDLTHGIGTARSFNLLWRGSERSYHVDVIARWQAIPKHEARFEIQILKQIKPGSGTRKTTQSEKTLTSLRVDYAASGYAAIDYPHSVRDLIGMEEASGFHGRRIRSLKKRENFAEFVKHLDRKLLFLEPDKKMPHDSRTEIRDLNQLASFVLDSLAGSDTLSKNVAREIVRRSELRFVDLARAVKSEAKKPSYYLLQTEDGTGWVRYSEAQASGLEFQKKHADYDEQLLKFISSAAKTVYRESRSYLETDSDNKLNFAFGFRADSEETRRPLLQYIRMLRRLKKQFPSQMTGNLRVFVSSADLSKPAFKEFFKEVGKSGVAKVIELDTASTNFKIQEFLQKNKNALVYGISEASAGPYQTRLVRSQVTPKAAFPVAMILSVRLASISEVSAEELRKVPGFLPQGIVGYKGNSLYISQLAYQLAYDIYASRRIAIMA